MNHDSSVKDNSTISIRLMCAVVFLVFTFSYLYRFQADELALVQYVMSHGMTHYSKLGGAIAITVILQLVQLALYSLRLFRRQCHAVTYLPSLFLLSVITDIDSDVTHGISLGAWWWTVLLFAVIWLVATLLHIAIWMGVRVRNPNKLFSRHMWMNLLVMALMMAAVSMTGNTNAVFHYRVRAESALLEGDWDCALKQGSKSLESDANLQMIRMYALSRTGKLGECLFNYPMVAKSDGILPVEGKSRFVMYPVDSLYRHLGARPKGEMTNYRYLQLLQKRDTVLNKSVADYRLCGLLLDRKIDLFVQELMDYYGENDSLDIDALPRHYREAMILYTHLRSHPAIVYHHSVMDEDWQNLQDLESQYPDPTERKVKVEEQYRSTYWYYYEYE